MNLSILLLFFLTILFNTIPVISPPTSLVLSYFYIKTQFNPIVLTIITVLGAAIGRVILAMICRYFGLKFLSQKMHYGYELLRQIIHKNSFLTAVSMFLYCLLPITTSPIFIVAGVARIKLQPIIIGFVFGRFINYLVIANIVSYGYKSIQDILGTNLFNPLTLGLQVLGVIGAIAITFLDWEKLIINKKITFSYDIFKKNKSNI